jgi:aspartate/methionine/tyrosine aminotransferase
MSLVNDGDEVIFFDPSYDCYRAQIKLAGGKPIGLPLKPKQQVRKSVKSEQ